MMIDRQMMTESMVKLITKSIIVVLLLLGAIYNLIIVFACYNDAISISSELSSIAIIVCGSLSLLLIRTLYYSISDLLMIGNFGVVQSLHHTDAGKLVSAIPERSDIEDRVIATHEVGHLVCYSLCYKDVIDMKITIVPRGNSNGHIYYHTKEYPETNIDLIKCLSYISGKRAEILENLHTHSIGGENDDMKKWDVIASSIINRTDIIFTEPNAKWQSDHNIEILKIFKSRLREIIDTLYADNKSAIKDAIYTVITDKTKDTDWCKALLESLNIKKSKNLFFKLDEDIKNANLCKSE